jgi:protein-S-isoprenylcysteine O-methyltransferase Ste14
MNAVDFVAVRSRARHEHGECRAYRRRLHTQDSIASARGEVHVQIAVGLVRALTSTRTTRAFRTVTAQMIGFGLYNVDHMNFAQALLQSSQDTLLLRLMFGGGALLVFLAALLRTWATAYLRTEVVHDMSQHSEALVADGPYRYMRNPLYLANLPLIAGGGESPQRLPYLNYYGGNSTA